MFDEIHSIRLLYKLLTSYRPDNARVQVRNQTFSVKMGWGRGVVELGHFDKHFLHFVKNRRKRGLHGNMEFFLLGTLNPIQDDGGGGWGCN